jgi:hypothetical protein
MRSERNFRSFRELSKRRARERERESEVEERVRLSSSTSARPFKRSTSSLRAEAPAGREASPSPAQQPHRRRLSDDRLDAALSVSAKRVVACKSSACADRRFEGSEGSVRTGIRWVLEENQGGRREAKERLMRRGVVAVAEA